MFAAGVAAFSYSKLARANGNPDPKQNFIGAAVIGGLVFFVAYTFMKFVLGL